MSMQPISIIRVVIAAALLAFPPVPRGNPAEAPLVPAYPPGPPPVSAHFLPDGGIEATTALLPQATTSCTTAPPTRTGPTNGATINTLLPIFYWAGNGGYGYRIQVSPQSNFASFILWQDWSGISGSVLYTFPFDNMAANTTYYWRMASLCAANTPGPYSSTYTFHTANIHGPFVNPPSLTAPADGANGLPQHVGFNWGNVSGATGWELCIAISQSDAQNGNCLRDFIYSNWQNSISDTSSDGTYFWAMRARDSRAYGNYGAARKFSVGAASVPPIVREARADRSMPYPVYPFYRGCPSIQHPTQDGNVTGCGGPYHGFPLGVCTDVVMDAYNAGAGANLWTAYQAEITSGSGPYKHGGPRNTEDMRTYFILHQQYFTQTLNVSYQPGDIAFFDWDSDGLSDHVGIISQVGLDGQPSTIVEAQSPGLPAIEDSWNGVTGPYSKPGHVMGHARLSGAAAPAPLSPAVALQQLRVLVDSPAVTLTVADSQGNEISPAYDPSLWAGNIIPAVPYIPGGDYADLGAERVVTLTDPLFDGTQFTARVTAPVSTTYHLRIESLQNGGLTGSNVFTETIGPGVSSNSPITLSAPGGTLQFAADPPANAPSFSAPDTLLLSGLAGTTAQASFAISETGGTLPLGSVSVTATNLLGQLGGTILGSTAVVTPSAFAIAAGGSQPLTIRMNLTGVQPGTYLGELVISSQYGGTRRMQLEVDIQPWLVYLPVTMN